MYFRFRRSAFGRRSGADNRRDLRALTDAGRVPGLIGYLDGVPVGWVSLGPREDFPHLAHSRSLKPVDERPVWSVVCFYVDPCYRRRGLMTALLEGAVAHAAARGGTLVEAYPIVPEGPLSGYQGFTGLLSTFRRAGFEEMARPSEGRAIMRRAVTDRPGSGSSG